jgi:hypothetical protein
VLIKSSFSDYYDGVAGMGVDRSICYLRYPKTESTDRFRFDRLPNYFPDDIGKIGESYRETDIAYWNHKLLCEFYIIGFCGSYVVGLSTPSHSRVYYGEEILKLNWQDGSYHYLGERQRVEDLVSKFHETKDDRLFQEFGTPIFLAKPDRQSCQCQLNPCLNDLQFYKYQDAYSAFQSIQGYISGVLGTTSKPVVEISNNSKIIKAGFDLKTSFRKRKQQDK